MKIRFDVLRPAVAAEGVLTDQRFELILTFPTDRTGGRRGRGLRVRRRRRGGRRKGRRFQAFLHLGELGHTIFEMFGIVVDHRRRTIVIIVILKWIIVRIVTAIVVIVICERFPAQRFFFSPWKTKTYRSVRYYRNRYHSCFLRLFSSEVFFFFFFSSRKNNQTANESNRST